MHTVVPGTKYIVATVYPPVRSQRAEGQRRGAGTPVILCPPSSASPSQEWIQNKSQSEILARDLVPLVQGRRHFLQTQRNRNANTRGRQKALELKFLSPEAHSHS